MLSQLLLLPFLRMIIGAARGLVLEFGGDGQRVTQRDHRRGRAARPGLTGAFVKDLLVWWR